MTKYRIPVDAAVDPRTVRDLRPEALGHDGRISILPASYWATTTVHERALFGHRTGTYSFPTIELVQLLRELLRGRPAIEIGAGNGVLAQELGIPATDSRQQEKPPYNQMYGVGGPLGAAVTYGPNVIEMDAAAAVRHFRPKVVIGCWVTWKYRPDDHARGGNEQGVDELDILANCDTLIMVGNERVHAKSRLMTQRRRIEYPPFLYSRAIGGGREFVGVWHGQGQAGGPPPGKKGK